MEAVLRSKLGAMHVAVADKSGGCGAFFDIHVVSPSFEGMTTMKQHRAVNEALAAEIASCHGVTLKTMTPAAWEAARKR